MTAYNESTYSSSKGIIYANPHPLRRTAGFFNRCLCRGRIHAAIRQPVRRRRLHAKPAFERALRLLLFRRQCFARAVVEKSARRDKSFVLTVYDKDAPTGLGWMHRVVADIPADVHRRNATSLQLSRCANIADRTGLDALGGRRHSRRCPPPQRGLAAIKPLRQHRRRPVRSHIGGNQFADLPHQVDAFVHGKTDAVMLQPRQHAAKRGLRSIVRHFFIRQYRSLIIKRRAHTPGIRQLYRIAHCLRRPVLCGEPFYGFLFKSNPLRLIEAV
ncbi:TPA: phosphatidylethanolamine-binding family protein [Neisseria meningitidis]